MFSPVNRDLWLFDARNLTTSEPGYCRAIPRALVLGGTGLVGRAIALRLSRSGWQVDLMGRTASRLPADAADAGARFLAADRNDVEQLAAAFGEGADLLVDCICYTAADATRLLPLLPSASSTVMISSKAVYVDDAGHHSNSEIAHLGSTARSAKPSRPLPRATWITQHRRAMEPTRWRPSMCFLTAATPLRSSGLRRSTAR